MLYLFTKFIIATIQALLNFRADADVALVEIHSLSSRLNSSKIDHTATRSFAVEISSAKETDLADWRILGDLYSPYRRDLIHALNVYSSCYERCCSGSII